MPQDLEQLQPHSGPLSTIAYKKQGSSFEEFLKWTDEKRLLAEAIRRLVEPSHHSLLDVGAGNGMLTDLLIDLFEEVVMVEPADVFHEQLQRLPNAELVGENVESFVESTLRTFDFILASHVFIYLHRPVHVLGQLMEHLNSGGRIVVVMLDPDCEYLRFITRFAKRVSPSLEAAEYRWTELLNDVTRLNTPYRTIALDSPVVAPSVGAFLDIGDFHFNTDVSAITPSIRHEMIDYLLDVSREGNDFVVNVRHQMLILDSP